jgi:hypothetical protein
VIFPCGCPQKAAFPPKNSLTGHWLTQKNTHLETYIFQIKEYLNLIKRHQKKCCTSNGQCKFAKGKGSNRAGL